MWKERLSGRSFFVLIGCVKKARECLHSGLIRLRNGLVDQRAIRRALFCIRPRRWVKGALAFLNVLPETGRTELFEVNSSGGFGIAP